MAATFGCLLLSLCVFCLVETLPISESSISKGKCSFKVLVEGREETVSSVLRAHGCTLTEGFLSLYKEGDISPSDNIGGNAVCAGFVALISYGVKENVLDNVCSKVSFVDTGSYCQINPKGAHLTRLLTTSVAMKLPQAYITALQTLSQFNGQESCNVVCEDTRSEMCSALVHIGDVFLSTVGLRKIPPTEGKKNNTQNPPRSGINNTSQPSPVTQPKKKGSIDYDKIKESIRQSMKGVKKNSTSTVASGNNDINNRSKNLPNGGSKNPSDRRPNNGNNPSDRRPNNGNNPSDRRPNYGNNPSDRRPNNGNNPSDRRPNYGNNPSDRRPNNGNNPSDRRPNYGNNPSDRRPNNGNNPFDRRPNYGNNPSDRRPNYGKNPFDRRPNYGNNPSDRRPNYGNNPSDRRPNYGNNPSDRRPNYGNNPSDRRPNYGNNPFDRRPNNGNNPSDRHPNNGNNPFDYRPNNGNNPSDRRPNYGNNPSDRRPNNGNNPFDRRPNYGNNPSDRRPNYGNNPFDYRPNNGNNPSDRRPNYSNNPFDRRPNNGNNPFDYRPKNGNNPFDRRPNNGNNPFDRRPNNGNNPFDRRPNNGNNDPSKGQPNNHFSKINASHSNVNSSANQNKTDSTRPSVAKNTSTSQNSSTGSKNPNKVISITKPKPTQTPTSTKEKSQNIDLVIPGNKDFGSPGDTDDFRGGKPNDLRTNPDADEFDERRNMLGGRFQDGPPKFKNDKDDILNEDLFPGKDINADQKPSQPPTKQQKVEVTKKPSSMPTESTLDDEEYHGHGTWHFVSIFLVISIIVVVGYFLVHHRKKLKGYLSERGRNRKHNYRPLSQQ